MERLSNELLMMICEQVLVFDQPIQTCYLVTNSRSAGWRPPSSRSEEKHIRRRDLVLFSVSKRIRSVALDVFWRRNMFLYCPESVKERKRAIAFLQSQVPSTRQLVRKFSVHFLLEHFDRKVQHEELCALLQPLEWIARRLDRSVKRQVDIHLWTIRDEYERHPCGHAQLMVFASLKRESWRLKSLNAGIRGLVAESWQNHTCPRHTRSKEAMLCGW